MDAAELKQNSDDRSTSNALLSPGLSRSSAGGWLPVEAVPVGATLRHASSVMMHY